jgi:hypothetical protein
MSQTGDNVFKFQNFEINFWVPDEIEVSLFGEQPLEIPLSGSKRSL